MCWMFAVAPRIPLWSRWTTLPERSLLSNLLDVGWETLVASILRLLEISWVLTISSSPLSITSNACIFQNNEAGFGEFPWTVAIIKTSDGSSHCGGSLIHPNLVLTGAHCVQGFRKGQLKIRAGEWDTQTTKERLPFQERSVVRVSSHPEFNPRSLAYDVAVLELESPIQLADHINVVCLPPNNYDTRRTDCFASGWGKNQFGKSGRYSVIMKKVPLPIVDASTCERQLQATRLTTKFRLHQTFICAGGEQGVDTCEGDGGAPLVCPVGPANENRYTQMGMVAWGIGCHGKVPAVYSNVMRFRSWIDNVVRTIGFDTSVYDANQSQFSSVFA